MTNLDRATTIRRTVANKAYDLLKDCKEPEPAFDGYDMYDKEFWTIEQADLEQEVAEALGWPEDEEAFIKQVKFHVSNFLDSDEYDSLKDRVRREYYQYQRDQKDLAQTNRAHQPTWRP